MAEAVLERNRLRRRRTLAALGAASVVGATAAGARRWSRTHTASAAVSAWRAPTLPLARVGELVVRHGGPGSDPNDRRAGILLLHGLVATGDVFGATVDLLARDHPVAVPDLLGFGRSLAPGRSDVSTRAHLTALDGAVDATLAGGPIRIGAHSMGSALALRWAAAHADRVERVVCLGAPLWPGPDAARAALGSAGPMARAFVLGEGLARRVCAWSCDHRWLAGWLAVLGAPRWPVPIARQASLHTWTAYRQTLLDQVVEPDWSALLAPLDAAGIPVTLVWGEDDLIGDPGHALDLARRLTTVRVRMVPGDHTLPAADPGLLVDLLGD